MAFRVTAADVVLLKYILIKSCICKATPYIEIIFPEESISNEWVPKLFSTCNTVQGSV